MCVVACVGCIDDPLLRFFWSILWGADLHVCAMKIIYGGGGTCGERVLQLSSKKDVFGGGGSADGGEMGDWILWKLSVGPITKHPSLVHLLCFFVDPVPFHTPNHSCFFLLTII